MTEISVDSKALNIKSSTKWRLIKFRVMNFRSIIDSGYIDIKNRATVLIGSNRARKSSLLNALEKLNYDETFNKFDLTQLGDISFDCIQQHKNFVIIHSGIQHILDFPDADQYL